MPCSNALNELLEPSIGTNSFENISLTIMPSFYYIYSNNGLFGDDGFSFGNSFGGSLLVGVMAFFPDAGGSVIQSLALSTIPFDISLFPENNRIIRGLDYDATLEALTLASPVPELASWAMMVLGFAGIGFMSYRRTRLA